MNQNQDFLYQPDKLAEMFLNQYHIWNPDAEDCRPEEMQFVRGRADWTLKWWRGGFYSWLKGRYIPLDGENLSALVTGFLQGINRMPYNPPDPPIKDNDRACEEYSAEPVGFRRSVCFGPEGIEYVAENGGRRTEDR